MTNSSQKCAMCNRLTCTDHTTCSDQHQLRYEKQIRKRTSYQRFKDVLEAYREDPTEEKVLRLVHQAVEDVWGYGSNAKSDYAKQSLDLLSRDIAKG